jgi:hypothetical protein
MIAAMTPLPVIGVPVRGSALDGLDSLLSIVQVLDFCFIEKLHHIAVLVVNLKLVLLQMCIYAAKRSLAP